MLYQLSYLAAGVSLAGFLRRSYGAQALDETVDEVALHEDRIGARLGHGIVELRGWITGERDQAQVGMVLPQPRDGSDSVDNRHVQVDHDRVGLELVRELDRIEAVARGPRHGQHGLVLDQGQERLEELTVVVHEEDAHRYRDRPVGVAHGLTLALPA